MPFSPRPLSRLADELEEMQSRCARLAEMFFGLAWAFGVLAAVSLAGCGAFHEPLLATSAGFALAAAAAFGLYGKALARTAARAPRLRRASVAILPDRRRA